MKFDDYGYPCINGSTDSEDSSHLAGILAITEHPKAVECIQYIESFMVRDVHREKFDYIHHLYGASKIKYVRCRDSKHDFSRDQAWLLMVGLLKQGYKDYVRTSFINGKDIIPLSLHGIETIAKRGKPYWFQKLWAKLEIWVHATFQPIEEPFQVIAACEAYDLYDFWTSRNKLWRWSIKRYLCELDGAWRNEPELAEHVIKYIESRISK